MEEKEEKFINMNIRSATTIKLRATYEYKKAKLESKYQNGYDWYFIIHKGDDGDYVTSTLEKIDGTIPSAWEAQELENQKLIDCTDIDLSKMGNCGDFE